MYTGPGGAELDLLATLIKQRIIRMNRELRRSKNLSPSRINYLSYRIRLMEKDMEDLNYSTYRDLYDKYQMLTNN